MQGPSAFATSCPITWSHFATVRTFRSASSLSFTALSRAFFSSTQLGFRVGPVSFRA